MKPHISTDEHEKVQYKELSYEIMNAVYQVHNTLGCGFLEKVYENALMIELRKRGLKAVQQPLIKVYYETEEVGGYFADILIEDKIILELKCVDSITNIHKAQTINYLNASGMSLGIILNFANPKLEYQRIVL